MDIELYKKQIAETVTEPMLEFHADEDDFESWKKSIKKCEKLLLKYLDELDQMKEPTNAVILKHVKNVVLALNRLNEDTEYELIETEEREAIAEIIQNAAIVCGLQDPSDDITEEWRDW